MSYTYLGSPYSHARGSIRMERYALNLSAFAWLAKNKIIAYSPIVHCHEAATKFKLPTDAAWWGAHNAALLSPAESLTILQLPGWKESKGLDIREAIRTKKDLYIMLPWQSGFLRDKTTFEELDSILGEDTRVNGVR
jgi:Domain of unknown function (DUF1937)